MPNMKEAINQLVTPYIKNIKQLSSDPQILASVDALDTNITNFVNNISVTNQLKSFELTPTEFEIAHDITAGKSSKDIARLMGISRETVGFHRRNIRAKLGLINRKINLRSHLSSRK